MAFVVCASCRHNNELGARECEVCGKPLSTTALRRAMGNSPLLWLRGTAVGQMLPFALLAVLLIGALLMGPTAAAWRQLMLTFGLVGLVTLGVIFPLLKGQYDFAAGPAAGLAACCAVVLSPHGWVPALLGALAVGCAVGAINGLIVGWTRLNSAMVTIITGAIALQVTIGYTAQAELTVTNPLLTSLGETNILGVPVILTLFILALVAARLMLNHPTFEAVAGSSSAAAAAARTTPDRILMSFLVSGFMSGLAGLLIASCGLADMGLAGQVLWVLTPLAAALIGGASVAAGTGNLRTAAVGAAVIAVTNWICAQLRMPISGPIVESPYLVIGLLSDRWKNMTWYMIAQARRGNLLAVPDELRLPMVILLTKGRSWAMQLGALVLFLAIGVGIYVYVGFYAARKVPAGTAAIARITGTVEVSRAGARQTSPATQGDSLRPGDTVIAGKGAEAILRFPDGSEVRVFANSEMNIKDLTTDEAGANKTQLALNVGSFFAKVHKLFSRRSAFSVETPLLTLGVRGTAFKVSVEQERGEVDVGEGRVEILQQLEVADARGKTRKLADSRTVEAGKAMETEQTAPLPTVVRELDDTEISSLRQTALTLASETRNAAFDKIKQHWWTVFVVVILVLYVWFVFIYCKPAPLEFLPDVIARRAKVLLASPTPTKADLPTSVALAQMYYNTGEVEKSKIQTARIIDADPDGEYGQWAMRFRSQIDRKKRA